MTFVTDEKAGIVLAHVSGDAPEFTLGLCVFDSNGGRKRLYVQASEALFVHDEILIDGDFQATAGTGIYRVPSGLSAQIHNNDYFWAESILDEKVLSLL